VSGFLFFFGSLSLFLNINLKNKKVIYANNITSVIDFDKIENRKKNIVGGA
jgi:hypothetical protein